MTLPFKWTRRHYSDSELDRYLDGNIHVLRPGIDYETVARIRAALWKAADQRGLRYRSRVHDGVLYVQALAEDGTELPDPQIIDPRASDAVPEPSPGQ